MSEKAEDSKKQEFMHRVRIAGVVVDGSLDVKRALMKVKGIGSRISDAVLPKLDIDEKTKIGSLNEKKIAEIEGKLEKLDELVPAWMLNRQKDKQTGKNMHLLGPELDMSVREDINMQKKIKSYRGVRHHLNLRVRGQRTRSTGRTGGTLGVKRKRG
ncbi:MAG: 30S ribosomal protein S13 [Candidatus Altiarchaeales archaeon]|nr:30S ribosomal protein S13 [Candidatus Altiarchaeales archaeon]